MRYLDKFAIDNRYFRIYRTFGDYTVEGYPEDPIYQPWQPMHEEDSICLHGINDFDLEVLATIIGVSHA